MSNYRSAPLFGSITYRDAATIQFSELPGCTDLWSTILRAADLDLDAISLVWHGHIAPDKITKKPTIGNYWIQQPIGGRVAKAAYLEGQVRRKTHREKWGFDAGNTTITLHTGLGDSSVR
ncbi:MAG: hypothetical protein HYV07_28705 [Deltaproteobacteria bacterium]|nr:hypothetical protein [Deltaproteobacteria bacterium]